MDPAQGREQLFDAAISEVDSFIYSEFDQPKKYVKDDTVDSLTLAQLPVRPSDHVKALFHLFDIQNDILLESAVDDVCASFIQHGPSAFAGEHPPCLAGAYHREAPADSPAYGFEDFARAMAEGQYDDWR